MNYARSLPEIFTDLLRQFMTLLRTEANLARAEMSEKISAAALGLGLIVGGAVLLIPGLVVLMLAGVAALEKAGLAPHWAALAVGGGVLVLGFILMAVGMSRLSAKRLVPSKTIEQIRRDANVAREQARSDHDPIQRAA
jgi:hypothetical protein